jgi:uncharacterized membrane protein
MRVWIRQVLDRLRHRLLFIPVLFVVLAVVLSRLTLGIDERIGTEDIPRTLETTVENARSILTAIAGGLITAVTLLLSMMLVAVQLASTQFSPRTLRNWIGDRSQQVAIGIVLGATVYSLLVLRQTRTVADGAPLTPSVSVLVAMVFGIGSLVVVVHSVDQLTNRLRVGSVAAEILDETVGIIESRNEVLPVDDPRLAGAEDDRDVPPDEAYPITATRSGWVQQIEAGEAIDRVPNGSTIYFPLAVGSFVFPDAPIAWVWPSPDNVSDCDEAIHRSVAVGDTRTMQQDIGFGITQMVDIALRALSPGVNDPNTASDLISHLGVVLLKLWERPVAPTTIESNGRTVIRRDLDHGDYLRAAFDPIRFYGASDPSVASTAIATLQTVRAETIRRGLAGPIQPLDEVIAEFADAVRAADLSDGDMSRVLAAAD